MIILTRVLGYWRGASSGSVNWRIFHAMTIIMAATVLVKVAAVAKDIVIAGTFGLGDELDAFLIALVIPAFAVTVLAESFDGAFMPAYIRVREQQGNADAKRLLGNVVVLNFCVMLAVTAVLAAAGDMVLRVVASEFSQEKRELAYSLYLVLLALLVLEGQSTLWGAVLNAGEKFALVALAPILTPLVIVGMLMLAGVHRLGIGALAWGTVIGCACELIVLGAVLARRGLLPLPRWSRSLKATRQVVHQYLPLVASAMIMSSSTVVDQMMASWLDAGSLAALNYGYKIPAFLSAIGITALGAAVLPHFSRLVAVGDYKTLRHTLKTYARWIILISVPIIALLCGASEWIVRAIFERGAFQRDDTALVTRIQQMYLLQVPFLVLGILGVRVLIAMSKNHLLTLMSIVNLVVSVCGNLILMRLMGVAGIALSTAVVYMISMTMIYVLLARNLRLLERGEAAIP